jgi:uncharacterized damage-inducible protein DinB
MAERDELLKTLNARRGFLRFTARNLTDEQARTATTPSVLTVGGLIKHVTGVERSWMAFAGGGAEAMEAIPVDWVGQFIMTDAETLDGLLAEYEKVAAHTDELVGTLDLDTAHPLPEKPWHEKGASWTVRQVVLHLIGETSQHSGHADIIREAIDGQKTMG